MGIDMKSVSPRLQASINEVMSKEHARRALHTAATIIATDPRKSVEAHDPYEPCLESELQRDCEAWLRLCGYQPRSQKAIHAGRPARGWYVHLHKAEGNHILLDLPVLDHSGRYKEYELKTKHGRVSKEQAAILANNPNAVLVRNFDEFKMELAKFMLASDGMELDHA